ncbi:MAG: hypothetical protein ACR2QQ_00015 [Gammaproteobacteria bacterium]
MKRIELGQSLTILANLAVLIGILLLIYELEFNRDMMRAQTRNELAQGIINQINILASDGELQEIIEKVESDAEDVTQVERNRYRAHVNARFRYWENVHYQYRLDLYDESEFATQTLAWKQFLDSRQVREIWRATSSSYSPDFAEELESLIVGPSN